MVIFRENTEDVYAGIEWSVNTPECKKIISFLKENMGLQFGMTRNRDKTNKYFWNQTFSATRNKICPEKSTAERYLGP